MCALLITKVKNAANIQWSGAERNFSFAEIFRKNISTECKNGFQANWAALSIDGSRTEHRHIPSSQASSWRNLPPRPKPARGLASYV